MFECTGPQSVILILCFALKVVETYAVFCQQVTVAEELRFVSEGYHEVVYVASLRAAKADQYLFSAFLSFVLVRASHAYKPKIVTDSAVACLLKRKRLN